MTKQENNKRWDAIVQLSFTELKERNRNLADKIVEKGRDLSEKKLQSLLESEFNLLREKGVLMPLEDLSGWIDKLVKAKNNVGWIEILADFASLVRKQINNHGYH